MTTLNSGVMVTFRGEFCIESKNASSAMKRQLVCHSIMPLHTIHKPDFYATTCSPKLLIFPGTGHGCGGFVSSDLSQVIWISKPQKIGKVYVLE